MLFMFERRLDVNVDRNILLCTGVGAGWEAAVDLLLEAGADIGESGALEVAAAVGHEGLVDSMMKAGAETDVVASALTAAAGGGYDTIVKKILENDVRISTAGSNHTSDALKVEVSGRDYQDRIGKWLWGALCAGAAARQTAVVKILMKGCGITAIGESLILAADGGDNDVVKLLVETGGNNEKLGRDHLTGVKERRSTAM